MLKREKPMRLFMAVDRDGKPRLTRGDGHIPLYEKADDARAGWGLGFDKPNVVRVTLHRERHK